ncbi:FHA domain-containing protein [Variovorax dokdonensis]|uniref:FHA domain-containing protein n=1 Tax=Variovorax dokdonensis TaxID=344883 RepID=A0ABT7NAG8_9BURK|nr:FHA domain-containing protein [Variovorax dokdonensis]MDM0044875.1 FHA domain-containing protein [Variovorax dokdonensis]
MARLLLMRKNSSARQIELSGDRTLIGRNADNDVQIDHPRASRHHAELRVEGQTTWLIDLGSRNGTLVNGRLIKQVELRHGDVITIGDCDIRFLTRHTNFELPKDLSLSA